MIEIFDVLGKRVYTELSGNKPIFIDVSKWDTGIYLVSLTNEKGNKVTRKFVKM
jgi:Secretion system C-terminal sorting domain